MWAVQARCVALHCPRHGPRGHGWDQAAGGVMRSKDGRGHPRRPRAHLLSHLLRAPRSTTQSTRQGWPARGHLAKGGQRKGTSGANTARAWAVTELNEPLSWPDRGQGAGAGTGSGRGERERARGKGAFHGHAERRSPPQLRGLPWVLTVPPQLNQSPATRQDCGCYDPSALFLGCPCGHLLSPGLASCPEHPQPNS